LTRGNRHTKLAEAWINFFLEPQAGNALVTRQGLANTTSDSRTLRTQDRLQWLEPAENVERRTLLWERILSGDRASKVLAP
jgi:putative spermidine/putrescine transport system substrate-binding protein